VLGVVSLFSSEVVVNETYFKKRFVKSIVVVFIY